MSPLGRGVTIALAGIGILTAMDAVAKTLVMGDLHLVQIMALRSLMILPALWLLHRVHGASEPLLPTRWRPSIARACAGVAAPLCFFASLRWLPLTDATVVAYNSVFAITVLSALLLRERVGPYRWSAIAVGYVGVFIALDPSGDGEALGYALVLLASLSYATLAIMGKWLGDTESSASLVFTYNAAVGVVCCAALPWVARWPSGAEWLGLVAFSAMAMVGQWLLTDAYRRVDGSLMAPLEYTSLLWVVVLDLAIWGQSPGSRTLVGAAVIIAASLYVVHRERVRARAT